MLGELPRCQEQAELGQKSEIKLTKETVRGASIHLRARGPFIEAPVQVPDLWRDMEKENKVGGYEVT